MAEAAALALMVTGSTMGAVSQYRQGKEQSDILKRNAQIAEQEAALISEAARKNAAIAEMEAERAREVKREEAREKRRETRRLLASQIAKYAKSGVKAGFGTPLIVSKEAGKQWERQAAIINEQGVYEWQYGMSMADVIRQTGEGQAGLALSRASLYKKQAKSAKRAGTIGAFTTLATSLGTAYLLSGFGSVDTSYGFQTGPAGSPFAGKTVGQSATMANRWLAAGP